MKATASDRPMLTLPQVGEYLQISRSRAYALAKEKGFPTCTIGGCIRVPREAFLRWVEERTHTASSRS